MRTESARIQRYDGRRHENDRGEGTLPGTVRPIVDERDGLLAYLAQQRFALRATVHGLTEEQARATPSASGLSLGGLIKHAAVCERGWVAGIVANRPATTATERNWETEFQLQDGESLEWALALYDEVAQETEAIVAEIPDLGRAVTVPPAPWYPKNVKAWSVRWVLLHLIEEVARHGGHADIVRESLDGKTWYELQAAAEGWSDVMAWASRDVPLE
jgi:uncharacterized damage-inducible protein DinB